MRGHRIERIRYADNPRSQWNNFARETVRISRSVIIFVMQFHRVEYAFKSVRAFQDPPADLRMQLNQPEFFGCQRSRFQQHGIGNSDFADIVQPRRQPNSFRLSQRNIDLARNRLGIFRNSEAMTRCVPIARVQCLR